MKGAVVAIAIVLIATATQAAGVVSTCNEAGLDAALVGGGMVSFSCDGTLTITGTKVIAVSTTIDSTGHNVSISGNGQMRIFSINSGASLSLTGLTLTGGNAGIEGGGAIINNGTLNLSDSTFAANTADFGAAIYSPSGQNFISDSTFFGNSALNASGTGGAISVGSGSLLISTSTFSGNSVTGPNGAGGAISVGETGNLQIFNSAFSDNSASGSNGSGGAIVSSAVFVSINNSSFSGNSAHFGGAIRFLLINSGSLAIGKCTFSNNSADSIAGSGGAIFHGGGTLGISGSTFVGNSAASGGAIDMIFGTLSIPNSTFYGNSATSAGGAVRLTFGTQIINYATFVGNSAPTAGALLRNGGTMSVAASIFSSSGGGECSGTVVDGTYNLSKDSTCNFVNTGSAQNVTDQQLNLGGLSSNGGPTQTLIPGRGSVALDAIPAGGICAVNNTIDQHGVGRPQHGRCDIGSVEVPYRVPPRLVSE